MKFKRHTLIDVSDAGRETILADLTANSPDRDGFRERLGRVLLPEQAGARVPGIVRREDVNPHPNCVPVGFSEPIPDGGERLRIPAFVRLDDIVSVTTPYELMSLHVSSRTTTMEALAAAGTCARSAGLALGVWGSAAMEIYTGLPCTRQDSDLDLIVAPASLKELSGFMAEIKAIEERYALRVDVELELASGYGVQLKELLGSGRTVLGKSLIDVALLNRSRILAELPQDGGFFAHNLSGPYPSMENCDHADVLF